MLQTFFAAVAGLFAAISLIDVLDGQWELMIQTRSALESADDVSRMRHRTFDEFLTN
jgi:hypothetical protein